MHLSFRGARRASAVALAASLAAAGLLSAGCTPVNTGTRVISGTISGADGKIVDVLMGFDVLDAAGNKINLGGGPGYSAMQRHNHCVGTSGATASQTCMFNGQVTQVTGKSWSLVVPSNAVKVFIEVYPKAPTPTAWLDNYRGYTGVAAGTTNTTTYATSYRAGMTIGNGLSNVAVVIPKVCGTSGGTTGSLYGHISGWPIGHAGSIHTWSFGPASAATQGFATSSVNSSGDYRIDGLQSGQAYGVIASNSYFYRSTFNYLSSISGNSKISYACQQKRFDF